LRRHRQLRRHASSFTGNRIVPAILLLRLFVNSLLWNAGNYNRCRSYEEHRRAGYTRHYLSSDAVLPAIFLYVDAAPRRHSYSGQAKVPSPAVNHRSAMCIVGVIFETDLRPSQI
jgi:hypothetical protein